MGIFLWVLQGLLAVMFLMAGGMKATQTPEQVQEAGGERMAWVESVSAGQLRAIGIIEVLIALGLVLPMLTGILPWLTPLAAIGLVCTMIGAAMLHVQRGDGMQSIAVNVVILLLGAIVVYGRFGLFSE